MCELLWDDERRTGTEGRIYRQDAKQGIRRGRLDKICCIMGNVYSRGEENEWVKAKPSNLNKICCIMGIVYYRGEENEWVKAKPSNLNKRCCIMGNMNITGENNEWVKAKQGNLAE